MNWDKEILFKLNQSQNRTWNFLLSHARILNLIWICTLSLFIHLENTNKTDLLFLATSLLGVYLSSTLLKFVFRRPRPAETFKKVMVRGSYRFPSFPSSEAAVFFCFASGISLLFSNDWFSIFGFTLASLGGLSRIYMGAHYPSDVLAGLVLGVSGALFCSSFF